MSSAQLRYAGSLIRLDPDRKSEIAENWLQFAKSKIAGQSRLLDHAAQMLEASCARMGDPDKPLGSILIPGPSGVGKTLLVKVFAEFLVHDQKGFIRIDGQDYSHSNRHMIARLTGAPLGYRDHEKDPILTQWNLDQFSWRAQFNEYYEDLTAEQKKKLNAIWKQRALLLQKIQTSELSDEERKKAVVTIEILEKQLIELKYPTYDPDTHDYLSIVLVDELGRGDKELHDLMYKILDEGHFVSAREEETNFRNTFIFMTDNAGSEEIAELLGRRAGKSVQIGFQGIQTEAQKSGAIDQQVYDISLRALKKYFETPFLNRIDHIVTARPHGKESLFEVLDIQIAELVVGLVFQKCPLSLEVSQEVKDFIVQESLDKPEENARALTRKFNHFIVKSLRRLRVTDQIKEGDYIKVELESGVKEKDKGKSKSTVVFYKVPNTANGKRKKQRLIMPPK